MEKGQNFNLFWVMEKTGLSQETLDRYIQEEWICPQKGQEILFDEEDLARVHLILDLQIRFGVNEEAVPIILHLIDQIHCLHRKIRKEK